MLTVIAGWANAGACGINWQRPVSHFDGVDQEGHVSYSEQIGELNLGEEQSLPLFIIFNSGWEASSPYLGKGWNLCLLESHVEQVDENAFKLVQPDGWYRMFGRGKADDTVMSGQGGWKAEINGSTITAYADCGWKLVFNQGKITSMTTPEGRHLDWVRENGRVSELREGNATRLKVEYGADGQAAALALPEGKRILLAQGNRPRVQLVNGQNIVAGVDRSLAGLTLADGQQRTYDFGTDEKTTAPTFQIGEGAGTKADEAAPAQPRLLGWDPQTKLATRDTAWAYQITPAQKFGDSAAIGRTSTQGQKEYWSYEPTQGKETTIALDGLKITKTWFVSGNLAGKTHSIVRVDHGKSAELLKRSYDQNGRLVREIKDGVTTFYDTNDKGLIEAKRDGKILWRFDSKSRDLTFNISDSQSVTYKIDPVNGAIIPK